MSEFTAMYFLWKREILRFIRARSRIVGSLAMPFFFLAILGSGLSGAFSSDATNGNYTSFIAPGIICMTLLFGSVFAGVTVIMDRKFGFLKETLIAPVNRTTIVLGKSIGGGTTAVIQALLLLIISLFMGVTFDLSPLTLAAAIFIMTITSMAFVALGIAIASCMEDMHGFQLVTNFLVMPMFFLSGGLFPLSNTPGYVQALSYLDPLTYAVEALRALFLHASVVPLETSVAVLVGFLAVCTLAAAWLFAKIEE
ncbi:hypothetical protein COX86_01655 [Candidatus Micrarchaeota archaeon CG_4_10_14_0_2_um_filter_60_11]|nr:MAG: hypothetical protein AUJ16_00970 [Candidatus Micrarchaeota archaeon CG1_02_60_51]PIN96102.1 MAG: hypothetical protein COU39_02800 [Candidatus Micrarchaeota archaeon CG10_big_fil_rev_8_21_14_0_10_60_32]PIO01608.1 MAG: hypothetical protein COT58_04420 [Candidatus Micrarchaeota archaeon CG09_land_8_20_14_0_10_60_16]PIZ91052.1 MAG: hypothetical protein COX86_01655 [Candidatus Micrarchaeota archaeon CG_4_10_14_0_2_um_filter_60_11]